VDPFFVVIGGGVVLLLAVMILLGITAPGTGAAQLDWKSPREQAEREAELESDDVAQMLEATNARRRARGERELRVRETLRGEVLLEDSGD
jgi:hypothetical protein